MERVLRCLILALLFCACDDRCFQEVLDDHRSELVACEPGETCVVPDEDARCACFGAYNQKQQELWDSLRSESRCEGCPEGFCPDQINPRCEDGKCVTDNAGLAAVDPAPRSEVGARRPRSAVRSTRTRRCTEGG